MLAYCLKRILAGALVLVALSVAVFAMVHAAPGSVETSLLGGGVRSPEAVAAVRAKYHLDESVVSQYGHWIGGVVKGDFGDSIKYRESATATIGSRAVVTSQLAVLAFCFSLLLGMGLGVLAAVRSRTTFDRTLVGSSIVGTSVPTFILGVLLIYVFSVELGWFPVSGPGTGGLDRLWHLILPAVTLGFSSYALVLKLTRAGVLSNMEQDSFLFARARGVRGWLLMRRYGLRAGLIPLVTSLALLLTYMLTGAILVEVVFGIPGLASLLVESVNAKDVPVIQALTLLTGVIVITLNLVADISYRLIDPRVRVSETSP